MILINSATTFQDTIPWLIALLGVIVAVYFGVKNLKLAREKNQREKRKHEKDITREATEGFKLKTDLDKYKKGIYDRFKEIDFTGLNAYQKKLPLERVYVRLKAKENYHLEDYQSIYDFEKLKKEISGKKNEKIASKSFSDVFTELSNNAENQNRALKMLILGHPGSGKTTLFKWIALQCVITTRNQHQATFSKYIPFFISLKDFAKNKDWLKQSLSQLVFIYFESRDLNMSFFKDRFERSEIIFLLDGLDEVADENLRREVIEWIERQHIRSNKLLVSSRFSGLNPQKGLLFGGDFRAFMIEDFDETDIEQFLYRWYEAIETVVEDSEANRKEAQRQAGELVEVIKNPEYKALRNIAVNPLLLTIVAIVHRNRAKLPKERHKLYDECLNVMIELWHIVHKRSNAFFPAEVCKNNLGKLACHAMKQNKREFSYEEIGELLPGEIEGKSLNFFINEMVLKAGLLYESEGKYGFLHLTFQEYLTAYTFAHSSNPLEILDYRDKDYWMQTIKLFVNVGNNQQFFDEISDGLKDKYWADSLFWIHCMDEIIDSHQKKKTEIRFAREVCNIFHGLQYNRNNDKIISALLFNELLYKHAYDLKSEAWNLFNASFHPFVKSIGASILGWSENLTAREMINALKIKLTKSSASLNALDFFMEFDNSIYLLMYKSRTIIDFCFVLELLQSPDLRVRMLVVRDIQDPRDIYNVYSSQNSRATTDEILNLSLIRGVCKEFFQLRTTEQIFRVFRDIHRLGKVVTPEVNLDDIRSLGDNFEDYCELEILEVMEQIDSLSGQSLQMLQSLSDTEIVKYFPNTTEDELLEFRENNTLKILQELKQENYHVLVNHLLTIDTLDEINYTIDKENAPGTFYKILISALKNKFKVNNLQIYKKRVLSWLTEKEMLQHDEETITFLLSFDLNPDDPEHQKEEIAAMKFLRKKDFKKWRELVALATQKRNDGDDRWVTAIYFFNVLN